MARSDRGTVLPFREPKQRAPRIVFRRAAAEEPDESQAATTDVDLTGKPKVWLLIGYGGSGKTTSTRWLVNRMSPEDMARTTLVSLAPRPGAQALATWFKQVRCPPDDPAQHGRWLVEVLAAIMRYKAQTIIDFGAGGEVALSYAINAVPDLHTAIEAEGLGLVLSYHMSSRIDEAEIIGEYEDSGFRPAARALMMRPNLDSYRIDPGAFAATTDREDYQAAVANGAVPIWLPPLEPWVMATIEEWRMPFSMARDGGQPEQAQQPPVNGLDRSMVTRWLRRMEDAHRPIATWLP